MLKPVGLLMVGLSFDRSVCALKESSLTDKIRDFIAEHLSVDFNDITNQSLI